MLKHKLKQGPNTGSHACLDYTLIRVSFWSGRAGRYPVGQRGGFQKDVLGSCFGLTVLIARQGHQPAQHQAPPGALGFERLLRPFKALMEEPPSAMRQLSVPTLDRSAAIVLSFVLGFLVCRLGLLLQYSIP
jgi:hypothetical protein